MTQADVSILNAAREASEMLAGIANDRRNESIFFGNGLVGEGNPIISEGNTSNFMKFVLYSLGGEFVARENATPEKIQSVETSTVTVETSERMLAARVNRTLLKRLAAGHKKEVEGRMNGIVDEWIGDVDKRLTTFLVAGDTGLDVTGDTFFAAAHTIPGSSTTFLNQRAATWVTTAATIKTAIMEMIADFEGMKNAHASLLNNPQEIEPVVVMYSGNGTNSLKEKMVDAVDPTLLTSTAGTNTLKGLVKHVNNPYLAVDTAFYGFMRVGQDRAMMYGEVDPGVELNTNAGNGATNMDIDQLLNNRDTYVASYDSAISYGNPFKAYQRKNA